MHITLLKSKLHRAKVTRVELDYEGSCAISADLLAAAGMHAYEKIHVYNVTNGERFETYAMCAQSGSGIVSINGAAAHRASVGDLVIICAFAQMSETEAAAHRPRLIYLDEDNRIVKTANAIPAQLA
jgi:aspartate 1-decarboxylase